MNSEQFETAATEAAAKVAAKYKRKYWWTNQDDLQQEAWLAMLKARPNFDGRFGDTPSARQRYLYKAADYSLRPFVWKHLSILSAPESQLHNLFQMGNAGGIHTDNYSAHAGSPASVADAVSSEPIQDELVEEANWHRRVRKRLSALFSKLDDGDLAEAAIMCGTAPADIASAFALPVSRVYAATKRVKMAVQKDQALFDLWKESTYAYN